MLPSLKSLVVTGAIGLALGSQAAFAATWDLPSPQPADNYISENVTWFADQVRDATDGQIDIKVHPGGSLFPGKEIKRAVQRNQAQIGVQLLSAYQNEDPLFGIDSVPFLATSFDESKTLWEVSRPVLDDILARQNLKLLYHIPWPPQGVFFDRAIETPEDARGLKFRAYNNATARFAELLGMTPTLIEEAELSQAAATGMVQSLISSGEPVYNHQLWSYLPHFYDARAWLVVSHVFVNKETWDALDDATRQRVLDIAARAEKRGEQRAKEMTEDLKAKLADKGVTIHQPSKALQAEFQSVGEQMQSDWLENAGGAGQQIIDAYHDAL